MANGTYEDTFDTEPTDEEEWENLMQLETARNNQQQVSSKQYLRERLREASKEYVKQQAKQQVKKLAAKATKALARVIFQAIMQGLRMIVVFLVATPVGWVIDVAILAVILTIIVVVNPGGALHAAKSLVCGGPNDYDPIALACRGGETLYSAPWGDIGGFLGGKNNPLY